MWSESEHTHPLSISQMRQDGETGKLGLGWGNVGVTEMCDFSLHAVKSRPAKVGDKLTTRNFGTGTLGFSASEDASVAVCVLPGTELSFTREVRCLPRMYAWRERVINHETAIFRQINKDRVSTHHDALEFPDGQIVLLTFLSEGQQAMVLQLPASGVEVKAPAPEREAMEIALWDSIAV